MSLGSKGGEVLRALPPANVALVRGPASTLYVWVCCCAFPKTPKNISAL